MTITPNLLQTLTRIRVKLRVLLKAMLAKNLKILRVVLLVPIVKRKGT